MITRNAHEWIMLISLLYVTSVVSRTQQRISSLMLFHKSGLIVILSFLKSNHAKDASTLVETLFVFNVQL